MQIANTTLCNSSVAAVQPTLKPPARQDLAQISQDWELTEEVKQSRDITRTVTNLKVEDRVKTNSRRFDVSDVDRDGEACPKWSEENGRYKYGAVLRTQSANKSRGVTTIKVCYDDGDELWQCRDDLMTMLSDDE